MIDGALIDMTPESFFPEIERYFDHTSGFVQ
jgi:hypothetical protein